MDNQPTKPHKINIFSLVMITAAFVISVRNLPMMAETGMHMIFFAFIAAVAYLVPCALVSAELATGWPKKGGVYAWVKEAFGDHWGFVAIWLQWIQMVFGMVTILMFVADAFAFVFNPALVHNKLYLIIMIVGVYWLLTLLNMRGMKTSSWISTVCVITGVFIPGALIIILGIIYLLLGNPIHLDLSLTAHNLLPTFSEIRNLVLFTGFVFVFMGMEVSASHANEIDNPQRKYPIAIFLAALLLFFLNVVGSMSIAIVVPHQEISLVAGLFEAFTIFFKTFHIQWLVPIIAFMVGLGAIGQLSTWVVGPVKGLSATADNGDLPPLLQKTNKHGIPVPLLIIQASLISLFGLTVVFIPKINSVFWMLLDMATLTYLIMYLMMFAAAIRLRYKEPNVQRAYQVPGGNFGMWIIAGIGFLVALFAFCVGFLPPAQLAMSDIVFYECFLIIGIIVMVIVPLVIYACRRPEWNEKV